MDWVSSDHDRLQHVTMNLIGNVVFTRRGAVAVTVENVGVEDAAELSSRSRTRVQATDDLTKNMCSMILSAWQHSLYRQVGGTGLASALQSGSCMPWEAKSASRCRRRQHIWVKMPVGHTDAPRDQSHFHIRYTKSFFDSPLVEVTKSTTRVKCFN
jgi:hypothetical protein